MSASIEQQMTWSETAALAVVETERSVVLVTGPDRLSWLNALLTCDLAKRQVGEAVHGLAVGMKGKIVTDVVVLVGEERALLVVQAATLPALLASFEHHLMMEDAEFAPLPGAEVAFIHGPRAADVRSSLAADGVTGGAFDLTGRGGAVVVLETATGRDALGPALKAVGGGVGDAAGWDVVRVLASVPRFGVDFDEGTYPQEASLETKAVSFQKGCYLGQEVVCMLEMRGHVKRKLVTLLVRGDTVPPARAAVTDANGAVIGEVTSAVRASKGDVRALAMVKYAFIAGGTAVVVGASEALVA